MKYFLGFFLGCLLTAGAFLHFYKPQFKVTPESFCREFGGVNYSAKDSGVEMVACKDTAGYIIRWDKIKPKEDMRN